MRAVGHNCGTLLPLLDWERFAAANRSQAVLHPNPSQSPIFASIAPQADAALCNPKLQSVSSLFASSRLLHKNPAEGWNAGSTGRWSNLANRLSAVDPYHNTRCMLRRNTQYRGGNHLCRSSLSSLSSFPSFQGPLKAPATANHYSPTIHNVHQHPHTLPALQSRLIAPNRANSQSSLIKPNQGKSRYYHQSAPA
jgi:hypothetical protein